MGEWGYRNVAQTSLSEHCETHYAHNSAGRVGGPPADV